MQQPADNENTIHPTTSPTTRSTCRRTRSLTGDGTPRVKGVPSHEKAWTPNPKPQPTDLLYLLDTNAQLNQRDPRRTQPRPNAGPPKRGKSKGTKRTVPSGGPDERKNAAGDRPQASDGFYGAAIEKDRLLLSTLSVVLSLGLRMPCAFLCTLSSGFGMCPSLLPFPVTLGFVERQPFLSAQST